MVNILCVCGNGMGTSTILKINIQKICVENKVDAGVESCSFSEAMTYLPSIDIVITSPEWAEMLPPSRATVATVKNLIDTAAVSKALLDIVREKFPDEINI